MSETVSEAVSPPGQDASPSPMFRSKRRVLLMKFVALLISTFFSLALIEVALRIVSPASVFGSGLPLRPHNRMILHLNNLHGVSPEAVNSTNKWGMRGDEPPK